MQPLSHAQYVRRSTLLANVSAMCPPRPQNVRKRNMAARVRHKPVTRKHSYVQDKQRRAVQT